MLFMNLLLDGVQPADPVEHLRGQWRLVEFVQIDKLASNVRPTSGFMHSAAFVDFQEAAISVGLRNTTEVLEMSLRMFDLAIGLGGQSKPHTFDRTHPMSHRLRQAPLSARARSRSPGESPA
jgi:hypothetical protein